MPRTVQQRRAYLVRLGVFWQHHSVCFLTVDVRIQVDDFNGDIQVVQEGHNLDLISLFVNLLHFRLTEKLDRQSIVNESLVENMIVFKLARSQKSHH